MTDIGEGHTICKGCGQEIDPETCWCGQPIADHISSTGCTFALPMGCNCLRNSTSTEPPEPPFGDQ